MGDINSYEKNIRPLKILQCNLRILVFSLFIVEVNLIKQVFVKSVKGLYVFGPTYKV